MRGLTVAPVADPGTLTVVEECRQALGYDARTADDLAWLNGCVHALTAPTVDPTPPGPSSSPSPTLTASPTPTATTPAPSPTTTSPTPTTPAPSSTGPSGPRTGCLSDPEACGYPGPHTTGARGPLVAYTGPLKLSTAGATLAGVRVNGCLELAAPNITLRDVEINCGNSSYAVDTPHGSSGGPAYSSGTTIIDHVTVRCTGHGGTAFGEARLVITYADIAGCENGADADGLVVMTRSYLHDLFKGDSVAPDPHTDGLQAWPTAAGIVFSDNTVLVRGDNAAFTIGAHANPTTIVIERNLLDGGSYTVYCAGHPGSLRDNRWGPIGPNHTAPWGHTDSCLQMTRSGNVEDATGGPALIE